MATVHGIPTKAPLDPTAIDHNVLLNLAVGDVHTQYLLMAGRAGGQDVFGDTAASGELSLRGTTNANLGQIRCKAPIIFDSTLAANGLNPYQVKASAAFNPTATVYVGGAFDASPSITFTSSIAVVYIAYNAQPFITANSTPAFATSFVLMNAGPTLYPGAAGHNPIPCIGMTFSPNYINLYASSRTTPGTTGIAVGALCKATLNGGTMNMTHQYGLFFEPLYSSVSGSTVNLGLCVAVKCDRPNTGASEPGTGTNTMTGYYGLSFESMTFAGNVPKRVINSDLGPASNAYCIYHTGGAQSRHEGGFHINEYLIHADDTDTYLRFQVDDVQLVAGGNVRVQCNGTGLGFFGATPVAQSAAYSITNVTTDRSYDANATTVDEVADALGTLIADLQALGIVG